MKYIFLVSYKHKNSVTLHARVWIEIRIRKLIIYYVGVTLHARVWIEILLFLVGIVKINVTLHARVWIEMV